MPRKPRKKRKPGPAGPEPECRCVLGPDGCPKCLAKLREISRLYEIAFLEMMKKVEWISETHKPGCRPCTVRHADDLGEAIMRDLAKAPRHIRDHAYKYLTAFMVGQGIMNLPKTAEAYAATRFRPGMRLDALLRELYSNS